MRRLIVVAVFAAVLVVAFAGSASAATTVELRYWPTSVTWNINGSTYNWNSGMFGLSLRRDLGPMWQVSFNGDWGSQSNWTGGIATSGSDGMWNVNLHRRISPPGPTSTTLFLGYGRVGWESDIQGFLRTYGLRAGADLMHQAGPWSVGAWAAFGIGNNADRGSNGVTYESASASTSDLGFKIGYAVRPNISVALGYRAVSMRWNPTTFIPSSTEWSGVIFAVRATLP